MLRNIILLLCSIILFLIGIVVYGIILNIREVSLDEAMDELNILKLNDVTIVVERQKYKLHLYSDTLLVKTYNAVFGPNNKIKTLDNDFATPIGTYEIVTIQDSSQYYKFFLINFPNKQDLAEAFKDRRITKEIFDEGIKSVENKKYGKRCGVIDYNIGIHGIGEYNSIFKNLPFVFNWTNGSISVSNEEMEELSSVIKVGTKVIIK